MVSAIILMVFIVLLFWVLGKIMNNNPRSSGDGAEKTSQKMQLNETLRDIRSVPENIDLESLPGPQREKLLYSYDEYICSPESTYFALAYSVDEISMMNNVGCIAWGKIELDKAVIKHTSSTVCATCWRSPWCIWLNEKEFMFKSQYYTDGQNKLPNIVVNMDKGVAIVPDSNTTEWWDENPSVSGLSYIPYTETVLLELVQNA